MPNVVETTRAALRRNGLVRSRTNKMLGGVCAGLARRTGLPVWVFRLGFIVGNFLPGPGLLVYVILWATLPQE